MIKFNRFSKDKDIVRAERLGKLSAHIDEFSAVLGLPPDKLEWAQTCGPFWDDLTRNKSVEFGMSCGNTMGLNLIVKPCVTRYVDLKVLLNTIIDGIDGDTDLKREYGIVGKSPRNFKKIVAALNRWENTHNRLVAEGDPRILPDSMMAELVDFRDRLNDSNHERVTQKRLLSDLVEQKRARFIFDTNMLRYMFAVCKLTWGPDDPTLTLLGFKTRSGVWTKKTEDEPEEPE